MRNNSLWSDVVFEKERIFHEFDFETSDLKFEVSKSRIWKHTTSCDNWVLFLSLISRNFDDQLSSSRHRFVIFCICWDTPTVKTSLWQLPIVSVSLKGFNSFCKFSFWPSHEPLITVNENVRYLYTFQQSSFLTDMVHYKMSVIIIKEAEGKTSLSCLLNSINGVLVEYFCYSQCISAL